MVAPEMRCTLSVPVSIVNAALHSPGRQSEGTACGGITVWACPSGPRQLTSTLNGIEMPTAAEPAHMDDDENDRPKAAKVEVPSGSWRRKLPAVIFVLLDPGGGCGS